MIERISMPRRAFKRFHRTLGTGGLLVAVLALIVALGGGAYAASVGLTARQKKEVIKIAKQFPRPGAEGPRGPQGPTGPQGPAGQPDTSNFYDKSQADSRFAQVNPSGGFQGAVFTNHVAISPADGTTATPVLSLPGGFTVNCYSNGTTSSMVRVEGTSPWVGTVSYAEGSVDHTFGVSSSVGGGALFGASVYDTARYQIMDSAGETAPTRIWTITVTIVRNTTGVTNGPHCLATATAGPA
jgi:hypothetical protein